MSPTRLRTQKSIQASSIRGPKCESCRERWRERTEKYYWVKSVLDLMQAYANYGSVDRAVKA